MWIIYIATVIVWCLLLTGVALSSRINYMSNRVFNCLLIISTIPILNSALLIVCMCNAIFDKRSEEERIEDFKKNCEHLDALLEAIIDKLKNNG